MINRTTTPVPDIDDDPVDVTTDMTPASSGAIGTVDAVAELARFDAMAELARKLIPASIKATRPQDWVVMGERAYLQGTGVERLAALWGLVFGEPTVERVDLADGGFEYVVTGAAGSRRTGVFYKAITGGRSSRDPFFDRFDQDKPRGFRDLATEEQLRWKAAHRLPVDPLDVRKAAVTNWQTRAASMLTGLRGLTVDDLEAAGLTGVRRVEFNRGAQGGKTATPELAARRTEFWNALLKRAGGDADVARTALRDLTKFDAYTRADGSKVNAYAGATSPDRLSEKQIAIAERKMVEHPIIGDEALEAGEPAGGDR